MDQHKHSPSQSDKPDRPKPIVAYVTTKVTVDTILPLKTPNLPLRVNCSPVENL